MAASLAPNFVTGEGWVRVSRAAPCPICDHPDWCGVSPDGRLAICMRVESDHPTANCGWLHHLDGTAILLPPRQSPKPGVPAPIERRDRVYRALKAELGLSEHHHARLVTERGVPASALDLFATAPPLNPDARLGIVRRVVFQVGDLDGVPGFYRERDGWTLVPTAPGILVPIPDLHGRVQGFQVRADSPAPHEPRYKWLSSTRWPGGATSGSPVAVWRSDRARSRVWITEGALKACVAAGHLDTCVLGVAGVANWRRVLDLLAGAPADLPVVVAFDADRLVKLDVCRAENDLCLALRRAGYAVRVATWDGPAKGLDDALVAGARINVADWRPRLAPLARPRRLATLPPPARPATRTLAEVQRCG